MNKRKRKHDGQWMDVDGEPVHVLADPAMSDATRKALEDLVRHTRKMLDAMPEKEFREMVDGKWTPPEDQPPAQPPERAAWSGELVVDVLVCTLATLLIAALVVAVMG